MCSNKRKVRFRTVFVFRSHGLRVLAILKCKRQTSLRAFVSISSFYGRCCCEIAVLKITLFISKHYGSITPRITSFENSNKMNMLHLFSSIVCLSFSTDASYHKVSSQATIFIPFVVPGASMRAWYRMWLIARAITSRCLYFRTLIWATSSHYER